MLHEEASHLLIGELRRQDTQPLKDPASIRIYHKRRKPSGIEQYGICGLRPDTVYTQQIFADLMERAAKKSIQIRAGSFGNETCNSLQLLFIVVADGRISSAGMDMDFKAA